MAKGAQIKSIDSIIVCASKGKSIWWENCHRCFPAAFFQNWQAIKLYHGIKANQFFEYTAENKKNQFPIISKKSK